jgi:hypothetical protein|tara:strand:+ start:159 stop:455 length:297 start_codon:yes stop_codon:yes gene_type:complete
MKLLLAGLLVIGEPVVASETLDSAPEPIEEQSPSDTAEQCQKAAEDLKNKMLGLEYFLMDKKDHKEKCSGLNWEQPSLEEYKKDPKSYLPESCTNGNI